MVAKHSPLRIVLTGILVVATIIAFLLMNIVVYGYARQWTLQRLSPDAGGNPVFVTTQAPGNPEVTPTPGDAPAIGLSHSEIQPTLTPWDGTGRVTVLVLGLDYRDWSAGSSAARSDTMILLSLDPLTRTAGMLSIPRDMWVSIPGFKHGKINTAHYLGDAYKLPGGGPGLAVKTVEQFLGVPINYYAQVDFGAFVRFIDEIGGVKVNVPEPITIDLLGGGAATKKTLQPGVQVLPGEWALAYARARNSRGGDFDRAVRQQQVILGIRERILSFDMLPLLISKADVLYQELAAGVHTNLALDQVIKLALLAVNIPDGAIHRGVIGDDYVLFARSPDNLSILIPLIDKIHVLRDEVFVSGGALSPGTPGGVRERILAEGARVVIRDASGTQGLAERTAEYLRGQGVNIVATGAAETRQTLSSLVDYRGKPHTARFLYDEVGISSFRFSFAEDPTSEVDLQLILGDDWAYDNPLP